MEPDKFWNCWRRATYSPKYSPSWFIGKVYSKWRMSHQNSEIPYSKKINPFYLPHGLNGILVSRNAEIGENCTVFHQVTIGSNTTKGSKKPGAPKIGNNVYIGAGAKVIGGVRVGDNVRVGANCVVVADLPDNCTAVLGDPCRVILHDGPQDNSFVDIAEAVQEQ